MRMDVLIAHVRRERVRCIPFASRCDEKLAVNCSVARCSHGKSFVFYSYPFLNIWYYWSIFYLLFISCFL
jgi:hypothetical protein